MELMDASVSKKASETPPLLSRSKRLHTLFQGRTEALRQRAPAKVLDGEEMKRLEETATVLGLPSPTRQAGADTASVCAQSSSSIMDINPAPDSVGVLMNHV